MNQDQRPSRIPDFRSREEEAEFWDTHDFTDYWDETRPVEITVSQALRDRVEARARKDLVDRLTVRLDRADREELTRRADEQGVGPSTLVRMWVRERLRGERATG
jgi:hypothetical protein